ncbi:DUF4402 domain-containing protein [Sphingoaurantiacus capsulatus]|uniref:DUF4402 domain-containing protein n=1 Tax=Sphingoaurantiacus capsulatus TaxID=1771310 RepID=A0ABV7X7I2_9SPHN
MPWRRRFHAAAFASALITGAPTFAQTIAIQTISANTPALGNVAAAAMGNTLFQVAASTGAITKISGNGVRTTTGNSRAQVTIRCTGTAAECNAASIRVRVAATGSPTGRLATLTNFNVASGTATISSVPTPANILNFVIDPIPRNTNRTFWVGADMAVQGDNSGIASGAATAPFNVRVSVNPATPVSPGTNGTAIATVRRAASIAKIADIDYGTVVRPTSGNSNVALNASTGVRTVGGNGAGVPSPAPRRAEFTISGEGGRTLSVTLPSNYVLTHSNGTNTITANLSRSPTGTLTLSGTQGSAGSIGLFVGSSFTMPAAVVPGVYSGTFNLTVQYN